MGEMQSGPVWEMGEYKFAQGMQGVSDMRGDKFTQTQMITQNLRTRRMNESPGS